MNYPTSDLQFVAQMLLKTQAHDQITNAEDVRLRQIAEHGHSSSPVEPPPPPAAGIDPEHLASATRAGGL